MLYEYDFQPETGEAADILPGSEMAASAVAVHAGAYQRLAVAGRMTAGPLSIRGFNSSVTRKTWEKCNQHGQLDKAPLTRVLVTHLHPDHAGCAGWLCELPMLLSCT